MSWLVIAFQMARSLLLLAVEPGGVPLIVEWDPEPRMPDFEFGGSRELQEDPIQRLISYAQGVILVIGVIGILYSAGKMAIGKLGQQSEIAVEGVGGIVWVIMGVCLMLVAVSVATTLAGVGP